MRRAVTLRRAWTDEPHGILNNCPPRPGACPFLENRTAVDCVLQAGDEALLSLLAIRRQQEREQVESIHVFVKNSPEIGAGGVRRWFRDLLSLWHGYLRDDFSV